MIDNKEKLLTLIVAIIITTIQVTIGIVGMIVFSWLINCTMGYTITDWTTIFFSCWFGTLLLDWYEELRT